MNEDLKSVQCQIDVPVVNGLKDQEITVGRHFVFKCRGGWDKSFDFEQAQFKFEDPKMNMNYKVIKAEARDTESFDVDVVSYVAGKSSFPALVMTDGKIKLSLGSQQFEVVSVLPKPEEKQTNEQAQPEPPKPFGYAVGEISWPYLYIIFIFLVFLSFIVLIVRRFQIKQKIKSYQSIVSSYDSAVLPDNQLYKKMRSIEKNDFPLSELDQAVKIYLLRTFQLPFLDLSPAVLYRLMIRKYPRDKKTIKTIDLTLKDLELFKKSTAVTLEQKIKFVNQFYTLMASCEAMVMKQKQRQAK